MTDVIKEFELKTKKEKFADPVTLIVYKDHAIAFSDKSGEKFNYLYNDQVKQLLNILLTFKLW